MRQHRYPRQYQQPQQAAPAPANSEDDDVDTLAQMVHGGSGTNSEYPSQYADQEAAILEQIVARRKAYMQRFGNAEQRYMQQGGNPQQVNAIRDNSEQEFNVDNLFEGDL